MNRAGAQRTPILKSPREVELMRAAGRVVFRVLSHVSEMAVPGVTTQELDEAAREIIAEAGAEALFIGQRTPQAKFPFPAALCTSVNEQVVHGIPGPRKLLEGDIVSVDCGVRLRGYCGDAATTIGVGKVSPEARRLIEVTRTALQIAIEESRCGVRWSEVARQIQAYVEGEGFSVVRDFVGHGIGQEMHEEPKVPNYWSRAQAKQDIVLRAGLTIAVEPMVNAGTAKVTYADATGWTVATQDGKLSAHFEHTIAVTKDGVEVLTDGR